MNDKDSKDLRGSSKAARDQLTNAAVTLLELVHTMDKSGVTALASPVAPEVLFELAQVQMNNVKSLAEMSAQQTKAVIDAMKERRERAKRAGAPPVRVLVSPDMEVGCEKSVTVSFVIRNEAKTERGYPLPDVVALERVPEEKAGPEDVVFVHVVFTEAGGGALVVPADCPLTFYAKAPSGVPTSFELHIPWNHRLRPGRYRGIVALEAEGAPSAELIIELRVRDKA